MLNCAIVDWKGSKNISNLFENDIIEIGGRMDIARIPDAIYEKQLINYMVKPT